MLTAATCANATTVTLGARELPKETPGLFACNTFGSGCTGYTIAQLFDPSLVDVAPASGLITGWRMQGGGTVRLRVLRATAPEEGEWTGDGTSAPATQVSGGTNPTSLPIHAGDLIGVDLPEEGGDIKWVNSSNAEVIKTASIIEEGEGQLWIFGQYDDKRMLLGADLVLAPVLSSLSPASGGPAGGNAVTLAGRYMDGATNVTFGSSPASSFSVDSAGQITAIAPAGTPSTVDVRVTGPGGSSEIAAADRYTYVASTGGSLLSPVAGGGPLSPGSGGALLSPGSGAVVAKPAVSGLGQSANRWRRGKGLPHVSSVPVGTTFSFTLNEPATASFLFTRRAVGRRVGGRCVAITSGNSGKPKCARTVVAGSFRLAAHVGLNKVSFQGRLSSSRSLAPGSYGLTLTARDSRGLTSSSQPLRFTIIA